MTRKKRNSAIVATFLVSTMLLTACGGNASNDEQKNNVDKGANNGGDKQVSTTESMDPLGPYEETITVTEVLGHGAPQDPKTPKGLTPQDNGYIKMLKDVLNIKLEYLWTVPSEQAEQKFALSVSSGVLPDVMALGLKDFEEFRLQGQLADLTEAYEKYASPTLRKYLEADGGRTLELFTYDGKLLGLPGYEDPFMSAQQLWIRKDWLDNLGLEAPTTIEELDKVAEAFAKNDPDMNGVDDTYGIAMNKELITWGFDARGAFNSMGAYPKAWIKGSNGELVPGEIQPETKTALQKMNEWYEKGILDKEFAFKDIDKAVEDVVAGKVGIAFGEWWYPEWPLNLNKDNDPKADWVVYPLPSFNGNAGLTLVPSLRLNWVVVANSDFENPEAVVKMANLYHELQTPKYKEINKPENGFVYNWYTARLYNPNNIEDLYTTVSEALKSDVEATEFENPEALSLYERSQKYLSGAGDNSDWGFYTARASEDGGWGMVRKIKENKAFIYNEYSGNPTPTQTERGSSLDKLTDETFVKIIMGGADISEFDSYVESWKKLGGSDITKEINDWYKER